MTLRPSAGPMTAEMMLAAFPAALLLRPCRRLTFVSRSIISVHVSSHEGTGQVRASS